MGSRGAVHHRRLANDVAGLKAAVATRDAGFGGTNVALVVSKAQDQATKSLPAGAPAG